ncbi:MAG: ester cyclase [Alphaproteobacteria bacterium]|nr:ester cyclase [Alphaproteobacteria bacterium]MCB9698104.1 ester cyclase [Alphaproteobacteria bacterium]
MTRTIATATLAGFLLTSSVALAKKRAEPAVDHAAEATRIAANLQTFDELDFQVFTHQEWDRLAESHAADILVHWPDGHTTTGLETHTADLRAMFVWAPDTRIEEHPIRVGQGEWTAVVGRMQGTFTEPMPIGEGQSIPATGKAFDLRMVTVGHWTEAGVMDEEYLFWDNQDFYRQIGLGQ